MVYDHTIDSSSFFGLTLFGVLPHDDTRVQRFKTIVEERLCVASSGGCGYVRYEGDQYYTASDTNTPNPWIVCTMWMAQYVIKAATKKQDLVRALELLEWASRTATKSGILAEQVHPRSGEHLSTAPLVWSHAEFVVTVDDYLEKYNALI